MHCTFYSFCDLISILSQVWVKLSSYVRSCHYEVMGLEHKKKYHFRVRAENKYGVGAPLDTDRLVTAKYSFGTVYHIFH